MVASIAHADPRVRRAACLALATRDAELWDCAAVAHLAAFDADPSVRAVAPQPP